MFINCFACFMTLSKRNDIVPLNRFHPKPKAGRPAATMVGSILCIAEINVGLAHPTEVHVYTLSACVFIFLETHCTHVLHISTLHIVSYHIYIYIHMYILLMVVALGTQTHTTRTQPRGDSVSSTFLEVQSDGVFL